MAEIPSEFYDSEQDAPFQHCTMCEVSLTEPPKTYVVEKAMKQYPGKGAQELVYEIAICQSCVEKSREAMSDESIQYLMEYMQENGPQIPGFQQGISGESQPEDNLDACLFTGTKREQLKEYKIVALLRGNELPYYSNPYLVSGDVMEDIASLLSPKTRDELNRMRDQILDIPPELEELFSDRDLVFL